MKVALYTPWENSWKDSLQKAFADKGHEAFWVKPYQAVGSVDKILCMWADDVAVGLSHANRVDLYTYIRSYELFTDMPERIEWKNVKGVFYCAEHIAEMANEKYPVINNLSQYVIHNWVDVEQWPCEEREGKDIAMVCDLNFKKNLPLAIQIMDKIRDYKLHIIGEVQDSSLMVYLVNLIDKLKLSENVIFCERVEYDKIPEFLKDKKYILSTSMREGCPMNILEAMAMGLRPIIHSWYGADILFPSKYIFGSVNDAVSMIKYGEYNAYEYRDYVRSNFNPSNADKIVEVVCGPESNGIR